MMKTIFTVIVTCFICTGWIQAQDEITNAFDDLKRQGTVSEEDSEMRKAASPDALEKLIGENPVAGYFCFTEDRMYDIRLKDAIPARWIERPVASRTEFKGECRPGEFYTWQIGLFSPYQDLNQLSIVFSDLKNENGNRIPASALRCFNLEGIDTEGKPFKKMVDISKGSVQALWIGMDVPVAATGLYKGKVLVKAMDAEPVQVDCSIEVAGPPIENHGDNDGWRKTRLQWLDSGIGNAEEPTAPYISVKEQKKRISWLGGTLEIARSGLPQMITTNYDANNRLDASVANKILAGEMIFIIETSAGEEVLKPGAVYVNKRTNASVDWTATQKSRNIEVTCSASFGFDGLADFKIRVKSLNDMQIEDIRLEVPYTEYASKYMMGLGHKGGLRKDSIVDWQWNIDKHQDKIWMGNINAGLNFCFKDENYVRPLVNIYYSLGKLNLPDSWGNRNRGGIRIGKGQNGEVRLIAYSGERTMAKGDILHYNFSMLVTPVKPLNLHELATERFYHSNSDLSSAYIEKAKEGGANWINIHHKKDVYPFINYPYYDEAMPDLKRFIADANNENIGVRLYYTTRELTVKIPELWALRSLGGEVIHDGPGKDARTLIHKEGPNEWLVKNLTTGFIPAWYNAFREGKYAGDMDISVITTPDSRWNNYYLEGLDWMVKNIHLGGVYIDDSALDHKTLQRARRILDADGKHRLIDIHSWNHMNQHAGFANSLHIYLELLPYVNRTWIGEGFKEVNTLDFWLVEMSGIPFGLMSEMLDSRNQFRGMVFGMLSRLPWSGNPVPLWGLWDEFGMKDAVMKGFWDKACPVSAGNPDLPATVYINGDKALVAIANWTDLPIAPQITIHEELLGFKPSKITLPEIRELQWGNERVNLNRMEIMGRSGLILLLEK
ncbi:MAG: DUF6067 family protein [Tannerella sp.]|jgi:hypothetical protein|nr:DUF6067 family protein [Tannerella sp.]